MERQVACQSTDDYHGYVFSCGGLALGSGRTCSRGGLLKSGLRCAWSAKKKEHASARVSKSVLLTLAT